MSQADVLQLVDDLSAGQTDFDVITDYYARAVYQLGRQPWMCTSTLLTTTVGTSQYTLPTTAIKLLWVFYDDRLLDRMSLRDVESINSRWRDEKGSPTAYVVEDESSKQFRLYPTPDRTAKDFIYLYGDPLGRDYPTYAAAVIHTESRTDVPSWLELPLAFDILAREYERESNHRDVAFANLCQSIADSLYAMVS